MIRYLGIFEAIPESVMVLDAIRSSVLSETSQTKTEDNNEESLNDPLQEPRAISSWIWNVQNAPRFLPRHDDADLAVARAFRESCFAQGETRYGESLDGWSVSFIRKGNLVFVALGSNDLFATQVVELFLKVVAYLGGTHEADGSWVLPNTQWLKTNTIKLALAVDEMILQGRVERHDAESIASRALSVHNALTKPAKKPAA